MITNNLQKFAALQLAWTPAGDVLVGVALAWLDTLDDKAWEIEIDADRINAAFKTLRGTCRQWPSPAEFLAVLKPRQQPPVIDKARRLSSDAINESGAKHVAEILGRFKSIEPMQDESQSS